MAAETLLRGIRAHGPPTAEARWPSCPAIALARRRDFAKFKTWIQASWVDDEVELRRYVRSTLGNDDRDDRLAAVSSPLGQRFSTPTRTTQRSTASV
jgi:hypothetical protein